MLSNQILSHIKDITDSLHDKSLNQIAKENKIEVIVSNLSHIGGKGISGAIVKHPKSKSYIIYINAQDSEMRQRFTFAHELGHFFLHKDILDKTNMIIDKNAQFLYRDEDYHGLDKNTKQREYEANEFAGNLLMPEMQFQKLVDKYSVKELTKLFQVSESAVTVRLYNLMMRGHERRI